MNFFFAFKREWKELCKNNYVTQHQLKPEKLHIVSHLVLFWCSDEIDGLRNAITTGVVSDMSVFATGDLFDYLRRFLWTFWHLWEMTWKVFGWEIIFKILKFKEMKQVFEKKN
jgi:hypothetical protein